PQSPAVSAGAEDVNRPYAYDPPPQPLVLLTQPLQISRHLGGVGEQLVERLAPLGLDLRDEPAATAQNLGPFELELVLLGPPGLQRRARCFECTLRPGKSRVRLRHLRFGVARGALQRAHREAALLQR